MSYFKDAYCELCYPVSSDDSPGLRNAQLGAIHSIASFHTLHKTNAGIIVMPTGSGKTAVLMMTPFIIRASKVLVVTPSVMVRGQIFEDFRGLVTLIKSRVFNENLEPPVVFELKNKYDNELRQSVIDANVVVASPICALSLSEAEIKGQFDLVLIDEAHHVPATTWQQILLNMNSAGKFLFTATPFRLDRREISGDIIYTYPLSMAYHDNIFGEIQYIPIEEALEKDKLIALESERIFLNDRQQGLDHYLMVRTDTKDKAKELEELYQKETALRLKRIDSSMSYRTIKTCINELRAKQIDGIICVDMLGEGFDFPNLKIAAIHSPHKSLASTLQFIGRFARTNAENIGTAKFIAMNDEELIIENYQLYRSDAIWQDIIVDMSERTIHRETEIRRDLGNFVPDDQTADSQISDIIPLHGIRPNCHAKVYHISGFDIEGVFPEIYCVNNVFRNLIDNTVVGVGAFITKPLWIETDHVLDIQNLLFIVHYQAETSLLFVYSQTKSEFDYKLIAESFTRDYDKIPRNEIHRVLGNMEEFEMFNTGMQSRFSENGESYRIHAGSNVASAIDPVTGKMFSAGHVFCKAISDGAPITIGYSSGSKIWSSSYLSIPEYIHWCDLYGRKIVNDRIVVKTNTNYDFLPTPTRLNAFPLNIIFCFFSDRTYSSPPVIMNTPDTPSNKILTDASILIDSISANKIDIIVMLENYREVVTYNVDGSYSSIEPSILLKDGRNRVFLPEYLNNYPLIFKTTDDAVIEGNEICTGVPNAIVFSPTNIISVNWAAYNTEIRLEVGIGSNGEQSIQSAIQEILLETNDFDYLIYDHASGEIADYITIKENDHTLKVVFYHAKAMHGANFNGDLTDIYEVTQQAVKSTIWLKSRVWLLSKIRDRRKSGHAILQKGQFTDLERTLKQNKQLTAEIVVVQPAISSKVAVPDRFQEVLAAAAFYIRNSGRVTNLKIWGS